ncbi:MAG: UDP-glucose--hexose-1-phosphate uridylyltransferase [Ignavibacteriales bacterium]|nr:UDP-glucose--hexose-1-phosphate uridylyltransferase [Ignavibacteriales bacterium]
MRTQRRESPELPHRRKNLLTGEWVLVSPQRTNRPWRGEISEPAVEQKLPYDPSCYLCPGNKRAGGEVNPNYEHTFVFTNDFPALVENPSDNSTKEDSRLSFRAEHGICRVVNFSPRHDLTLAEMTQSEIERVIVAWKEEFTRLGSNPRINYVQIFENKGLLMGTSNSHPHSQIWAQQSIPTEPAKELKQFKLYYRGKKRGLLADYLKLELRIKERVVYENPSFVVLVPYWATWPYETLVVSRRTIGSLLQFTSREVKDFANALRVTTIKYDNIFQTSFPYSAGLHQAPTDGKNHSEWHFHAHFYPPLLRSATVKKFMVGYEMLAEPQRDNAPELSAKVLRDLPVRHYKVSVFRIGVTSPLTKLLWERKLEHCQLAILLPFSQDC